MQHPVSMRFAFLFAVVLAVAAGLVWFVLEGADSALAAADATIIAALPLPYAASCWLADASARRALKKNEAAASDATVLALLKDIDTLLLPRRRFMIGEPHIKELVPEGMSQSDLLALAASAEQDATHPYAKVLCAVASDRRLRLHRLSAATLVPHAGAEALLMGQTLRVGRLDWLEAEGVKTSAELATRADQLAIHGLALIGVALGPRTRGLIAFEEDVSETAKKTIADLERHGITTILCTHGGRRYANAMQKALGTTEAKSLANTDSLTRELQLRKAKGHVIASLVPPLDTAADLTIDDTPPSSDKAATVAHTPMLQIASLSTLPALITSLRSIARALRSSCRLALAGLILLALPAFGLLHAIGGPFLPPAAAAVGLAVFTIACGFLFLAKKS